LSVFLTYLTRFENMDKRLSLHEEKFLGEVGLKQLHVTDAVTIKRESCLVGELLVIRCGQILRQVHAHMKHLEPLCKLLH